MEKLAVVVMGQDCEKFLNMCFKSVKDADILIYIDGGSKDKSIEIAKQFNTKIIENYFDKQNPKSNGKQRNCYLDYLKKNYPDYWGLALDADEVVDNGGIVKLKQIINEIKAGIYCIRMRHLIADLAHEDSTTQIHWVLNRLFKISHAGNYDEVEHPVLNPIANIPNENAGIAAVTIWHLSYIPGMWKLLEQYKRQLGVSNMHTKEYLENWYYQHIFGQYPKTSINPILLPTPILEEFLINKDKIYFSNRQLELKHFVDCIQWRQYFNLTQESSVLFIGDGLGVRTFAMSNLGIISHGFDISEYAVKNNIGLAKHAYWQQDIVHGVHKALYYSLVVAYDILEHLDYEDLDKALDNIYNYGIMNYLFSIPFKGDPNLEADSTHKIKETKEWWINKFQEHKFIIKETPQWLQYSQQIIIAEK